ncbi:Icc protein [Marinospirillum celere]|uniref:Icc protein n=1 Tax=Marinospirillum celere TaxID=1122252 RepID=A0A1I1FRN9_9GAMM|nr:metallophosphoesterase [Marinospirillum celere]SFC00278.1 Icc protein [Marinospirillum celere]
MAEKLRVIQLTDLHLLAEPGALFKGVDTRKRFLQALEKVQELKADLLLLTGDLAQDEAAATYAWLATELNKSALPWFWLPGNHDDPELMAPWAAPVFEFQQQGWQFLGLNTRQPGSASGRLGTQELERLQVALEQQQPLLIAMHHHPLAVRSAWMDALALEQNEDFWQRVEKATCPPVIICGHVHQEQSWEHRGAQVFSTPATAVQFAPQKDEFQLDLQTPAGLRWLDLQANGDWNTEVVHFP